MGILDLFRLDGRVAVVTGGGTGIGRGIALGLADAGADIVVAGRRREPLDGSRPRSARGPPALAVPTDVTVEAQVERWPSRPRVRAGRRLGQQRGGLQGEPMGPLAGTTEASWHTTVDRNLTPIFLSAGVAPAPLVDGGAILNVSSTASATRGAPGHGVYTRQGGGQPPHPDDGARAGAPRIRVNAIARATPRPPTTSSTSGFTDAQFAKLATKQPLGRLGRDDDYAAAAIYLCSEASSWVTGQTVYVSGTP